MLHTCGKPHMQVPYAAVFPIPYSYDGMHWPSHSITSHHLVKLFVKIIVDHLWWAKLSEPPCAALVLDTRYNVGSSSLLACLRKQADHLLRLSHLATFSPTKQVVGIRSGNWGEVIWVHVRKDAADERSQTCYTTYCGYWTFHIFMQTQTFPFRWSEMDRVLLQHGLNSTILFKDYLASSSYIRMSGHWGPNSQLSHTNMHMYIYTFVFGKTSNLLIILRHCV